MYTPKRVLAPVDFGACSETALDQALAVLAFRSDARLRILHVYEPPYYAPEALVNLPGEPPLPMIDYVRQQADNQLEAFVAARRDAVEAARWPAERIDWKLTAGLAFEEIPREAAAWNADLLVLGTHGRRGFAHLLLGSVAERVIRHTPCPVLVVRATGGKDVGALAFDRVLVPVDFGPDAAAAAKAGRALSARGASGVTLLHVVPTPAYAGEVMVPRAGGIRLGQYLHDEAQQRLLGFAREVFGSAGGHGTDGPELLVTQGSAAEQIAHIAAESDARLIVMGTKGRHGLAHFFVGSVAERVLRHSPCPVLITRGVFGEPPTT